MKRCCILLAAVLLLCLGTSARAEDGDRIEVITMDGVSVIMMTTEDASTPYSADGAFALPRMLAQIGEEAFAGVSAKRIEVSENVTSIGPRAFADCKSLREIVIPPGVQSIDEHAMDGCENVVVYGEKGSAAERFVQALKTANPGVSIMFADLDAIFNERPTLTSPPAVVLPFVPIS